MGSMAGNPAGVEPSRAFLLGITPERDAYRERLRIHLKESPVSLLNFTITSKRSASVSRANAWCPRVAGTRRPEQLARRA